MKTTKRAGSLDSYHERYEPAIKQQLSLEKPLSKSKNGSANSEKRFFKYHNGLAFAISLANFNFGYFISVPLLLRRSIERDIRGFDDQQFATFNSVLYLGAIMGTLINHRVYEKGGRRGCIILSYILYIIGGLVSGLADSVIALMTGRILAGAGLGITTVAVPSFVSENTPDSKRGMIGTAVNVMMSFGIVAASILEWPLSDKRVSCYLEPIWMSIEPIYWRVCFIPPVITSLLGFYLIEFVYTSDSPSWLVKWGRYEEAHYVLQQIHIEESSEGLTNRVASDSLIGIAKAHINALKNKKLDWWTVATTKHYRFLLFIGVFLVMLQQVSGINYLLSCATSMFVEAGMSEQHASIGMLFMTMGGVVARMCSGLLVEKVGRRFLLCLGATLMALFLILPLLIFPYVLHGSVYIAIGVIGAVFIFSMTLGPGVWIYLSEIYPEECRESAYLVCGVLSWVSSFAVIYFGAALSVHQAMAVFGGACILGDLLILGYLKETTNRSLFAENLYIPDHIRATNIASDDVALSLMVPILQRDGDSAVVR